MVAQMFKMGKNGISALLYHGFHHFCFIIRFGITFFQCYGSFGAMPDACTQPVAKQIADQSRFSINNL